MRKIITIVSIISIFILIVAAIPALIPDEEYTPGVKQWLKEANNPEKIPAKENRFNAMAGLFVEADKHFIAEGEKLVQEVNNQLSDPANKTKSTIKFNPYWRNKPLKTSDKLSDLTNVAFDKGPVKWLAENQSSYQSLIKDNRVLLDRFRKILAMNKYSYRMKHDIRAPFLLYGNILALKRLHNLSILDDYRKVGKKTAIAKLKQSISSSRLMMEQAVILLDKMVAVNFLKTDLITYSSLLELVRSDQTPGFTITNLNDKERSMQKSIQGEFSMLSTSLNIERAFALGGSSPGTGLFEKYVMKAYLKPNALQNNSHKTIWEPLLTLGQLSFADRVKKGAEISDVEFSWWQIYKDPVGYILISIATPSYSVYADRIDHADARITLVNLKAEIYYRKIPASKIENYIKKSNSEINSGYKGAKFSWDKSDQVISYDIPGYKNERIPRVKLAFKQ